VVVAVGVAGALAGLAVAGNPVDRLDDAWHSFKGGYATDASQSRLVSGLGSNRYDFYRVALDQFRGHPVAGVGADNFFQDYLAHKEITFTYTEIGTGPKGETVIYALNSVTKKQGRPVALVEQFGALHK
jgi:O-antigen ligase